MKIITILSLCLTASLSFAHSTLFYRERGDAFAYDDSGLCANLPNCYPSMKNLPEIDDNSLLPPMPLRVGKSIAVYGPSFGSDFHFVIAGADGKSITYSASNKKIDEYEAIYNKYNMLGFSSKADASSYDYSGICTDISNCNFAATFDALYKIAPVPFDIYDLSAFQCNSEFIARIHGNPCPVEYNNRSLKKYRLPTHAADTISYDDSNIYEFEPSPFSLDELYDTVYGLNIPYQHSDRRISDRTIWFTTEPNFHLNYAKHVIRQLKFSSHRYGFPSKTDAFTYDDSGLCANLPNRYPSMINLPEIDDNSLLPQCHYVLENQ